MQSWFPTGGIPIQSKQLRRFHQHRQCQTQILWQGGRCRGKCQSFIPRRFARNSRRWPWRIWRGRVFWYGQRWGPWFPLPARRLLESRDGLESGRPFWGHFQSHDCPFLSAASFSERNIPAQIREEWESIEMASLIFLMELDWRFFWQDWLEKDADGILAGYFGEESGLSELMKIRNKVKSVECLGSLLYYRTSAGRCLRV